MSYRNFLVQYNVNMFANKCLCVLLILVKVHSGMLLAQDYPTELYMSAAICCLNLIDDFLDIYFVCLVSTPPLKTAVSVV